MNTITTFWKTTIGKITIPGGGWLPVKLLAVQGGWVVVDDGQGPLWVMMDHVYEGDWPVVAIFERLRHRRN